MRCCLRCRFSRLFFSHGFPFLLLKSFQNNLKVRGRARGEKKDRRGRVGARKGPEMGQKDKKDTKNTVFCQYVKIYSFSKNI